MTTRVMGGERTRTSIFYVVGVVVVVLAVLGYLRLGQESELVPGS